MSKEPLKTVIIGSGPAGYTAAIYAARALLKPVLYTGKEPGGQLMITTDVENFPGYPDGIMGPQMMEDLKKQAERFDTKVNYELINKVDLSGPIHKVWTESGEEIHAHTVIISTGASARWLGIESEQRFMNKGVSACAVCDGFFYRGQKVAVIGGGNTALEEALYLSNIAEHVTMVHRRGEFRGEKILQDKVKEKAENGNISLEWHHELEEVVGDDMGVNGIRVRDNRSDDIKQIDVTGCFIAIGHTPNTDIFKGQLDMNGGYIKVRSGLEGNATATTVPGVFAAGDVMDHVYRQAVTSAGSGCMAALDAERYLDHLAATQETAETETTAAL